MEVPLTIDIDEDLIIYYLEENDLETSGVNVQKVIDEIISTAKEMAEDDDAVEEAVSWLLVG